MWQAGWEGSFGEMGTHRCVAESLFCSLETITALFIGYTSKQNKELKNYPEKILIEGALVQALGN